MNAHVIQFTIAFLLLLLPACEQKKPTPPKTIHSLTKRELLLLYQIAVKYRNDTDGLYSTNIPDRFKKHGFVASVATNENIVFMGPLRDTNNPISCIRLLALLPSAENSWFGFELFNENEEKGERILNMSKTEEISIAVLEELLEYSKSDKVTQADIEAKARSLGILVD